MVPGLCNGRAFRLRAFLVVAALLLSGVRAAPSSVLPEAAAVAVSFHVDAAAAALLVSTLRGGYRARQPIRRFRNSVSSR